jgi:hypothetical protein
MRHIDCRQFQIALDQLSSNAIHLGPLLPPIEDDSQIRSA